MNYHHGVVMPGTVVAVPTTFTSEDRLVAISTSSTDVTFTTNGSTILVANAGKLPAGYALYVAPRDLGVLLPPSVRSIFNRLRSYIV